jgi:PadR family transcriptional regulator, regulatory protein PadR
MNSMTYHRPGATGMTRVLLTRRRRRVLLALLADAADMSGYPLCRAAQVGPGTVYPLLGHLENAGWVTGEWDTKTAPNGGRRRFYRLTDEGRAAVAAALKLEMQQ